MILEGAGMVLKKGPWTAAEDETLAAYVREYGEGNWNAVQKKTWLARCGKSCRLRWANHLRPNLRKGSFSAHEEHLIIQLHSQLGNKWARMAAQLPGRTDNEIKNYWNTRLKRFQRQGLPLYPPHISSSPSEPSSSFTFQTPSLHPNTAFTSSPSSYPPYSIEPELPSNQNPYHFAHNDTPNTNLHMTTCQLLEDLMQEALDCRAPKRRKLMTMPQDNNDSFFSASFRPFASSNNLCPRQDLEPKEEEPLQINTMQYEDIAKLLDWGTESEEISNGQSSEETTDHRLLLDVHQLALLFPVDDDNNNNNNNNNNNTNTNPTMSSYSWDNLPGFC